MAALRPGVKPDCRGLLALARGAITVDLSRFSGPVDAAWVDPTTGDAHDLGAALPNTGTRCFSPPGSNAAGDSDWVLILAHE